MKRQSLLSTNKLETQPGLNFINVLRTAFTHVDPESLRIQLGHQCLFMLLGSTSVKAVRRMLMKLSPSHTWCQFHQHSMFNFYTPGAQKRKMTMLT